MVGLWKGKGFATSTRTHPSRAAAAAVVVDDDDVSVE